MKPYYSVVIAYTETNRTIWHPTDKSGPFSVLTRGVFDTIEAAHEWALDRIPNTEYSVRRY